MGLIECPKIMMLIGILSIPVYGMLVKAFYGEKFEGLDVLKSLRSKWQHLSAYFNIPNPCEKLFTSVIQ